GGRARLSSARRDAISLLLRRAEDPARRDALPSEWLSHIFSSSSLPRPSRAVARNDHLPVRTSSGKGISISERAVIWRTMLVRRCRSVIETFTLSKPPFGL